MRFDREQLLGKLEAVAPGLATREAVEQSSCFAFQGGNVYTFNDEVCCCLPLDIGITGAVAAKPLLELLRKLTETEVDIQTEKDGARLLVKGKRRRAGINLEAEVTLPVDSVERPDTFAPLGEDFADGVSVVQSCASKDANSFHLTCIHVTPDCVEACDNFQLARYPVETGVTEACLVKRDSLKHIVGLGMTEVCETESWLHFRGPSGMVLSVRRELMEFENLDPILATEGQVTTLPGGLAEAVEKAEIFSAEDSENNIIIVRLKQGEMRIKGTGASGFYEERKVAKWNGPPVAFSISPKMLTDISGRTNDCQIGEGLLKVDGGKFQYVTVLGALEDA